MVAEAREGPFEVGQEAHMEEKQPDGLVGEGMIHHLQPLAAREHFCIKRRHNVPHKHIRPNAARSQVRVECRREEPQRVRDEADDGHRRVGIVHKELLAPVD